MNEVWDSPFFYFVAAWFCGVTVAACFYFAGVSSAVLKWIPWLGPDKES